MTKETAIKLFNQNQVRCHWDVKKEKWYFSIVDVVEILTESIDAEAFKIWLARVASERMDEIVDPEVGIDRFMKTTGKLPNKAGPLEEIHAKRLSQNPARKS